MYGRRSLAWPLSRLARGGGEIGAARGQDARRGLAGCTVITLFKDTPAERKFARRSIPAAVRLGPSEIVIGADAPLSGEFADYVRGIFDGGGGREGYGQYRIVAVPRTPDWSFHPVHVLWECIAASRHDRILIADVDSELRPEAALGAGLVGTDRRAIVGMTKNRLQGSIAQRWRHWNQRRRILRSPIRPFSGTFWMYRPLILSALSAKECQGIENGFDSVILQAAQRDAACRVDGLREMGSNSLDIENEDQPWRQFMLGVYMYGQDALHHRDMVARRPCKRSRIRRLAQVRSNLHESRLWPLLYIKGPLRQTIEDAYPWTIRGWVWSHRNSSHPAVVSTYGMDYLTWQMTQAHHVKQVRDWAAVGRAGTGFE